MHEILRNLAAGQRILDLGCASGSFPLAATAARVTRLDRDAPSKTGHAGGFVQADAARLPFPDGSFDAVISNHSLEHFEDLSGVLAEIRRVIRSGGALFVAVPDASTLTDRIYRWLGRGGGHVNAFTSPVEVAALIEKATALPHVATRTLFSSLSFLNRRNAPRPLPKRLLLLGAGYEWTLFWYVWLSRCFDRLLGTRTGVYGWAFYFGTIGEAINTSSWPNVCIRCGSGHSAEVLQFRRKFGVKVYYCPGCGSCNPFVLR